MASVGSYQRWYDADIALSELVHTLESLSTQSQTLFALLINRFADRIVQVRGHDFYTQLDWEKLMGILKSKHSRRWYDQEMIMHKTLNKLYSLSTIDQNLIARELCGPIQFISDYEKACLHQCNLPDIHRVYHLIQQCFTQEVVYINHANNTPV